MSENWTEIAAEVNDAIKSIGTTDAGFICTLRRPGTPTGPAYDPTPGAPTYYEVPALDMSERIRDKDGTLVGQTMRTLTIPATVVAPAKSDTIAIGVAQADVVEGTTLFTEIKAVRPLAPAGVAVQYELDVEI